MKNNLDIHAIAYQGGNPYDFDNKILMQWYPKRIAMSSKGARSILELGLGHGFSTNIFAKIFDRHVVLEGSPAVIRSFAGKFPKCSAQIIETYFEAFDTNERFDVIVMGFILEHVDNPLEIISRYKNFLTPGGRIFLAVPNAEVLNRRLGHLGGLLDDMEALSDNDLVLGHKRYYNVNTLTEEITHAGCQVDKMEGIYLKPFTTNQMISLNLNKNIVEALCNVAIDYPELSCGIFAQISVR